MIKILQIRHILHVKSLSIKLFTIILIFCTQNTANAENLDSQHANWSVFERQLNNKRICYIVGEIISEAGDATSRKAPYITITSFDPKLDDEFSVSSGYVYKQNDIKIIFDKKTKFSLISKEKHAWPASNNDDRKIISLMLNSKQLEIIGTSLQKQTSIDTYSLVGFKKAYKRMQKLCNSKLQSK